MTEIDMADTDQELKRAFAEWAKEKWDHVHKTGVAIKHLTVDQIVAEFDREQQVRRDLESKTDQGV